jgi:hypothetical protein
MPSEMMSGLSHAGKETRKDGLVNVGVVNMSILRMIIVDTLLAFNGCTRTNRDYGRDK